MKISVALATSLLVSLTAVANTYQTESRHGGGNGYGNTQPNQGRSGLNSEACNENGQPMAMNNAQVLEWKTSEPNQFHARGYVSGTVDQLFSDLTGHHHFSVKIGPNANDHVEVIYQLNFGAMPEPQIGDQAVACGDFINAFSQSGGNMPSPDGALIHWVHQSPEASHDSGFVILNGTLYGNGPGN